MAAHPSPPGGTTGQALVKASDEDGDVKWEDKQDKLTGAAGQVVGFDANGEAVAQDAPAAGITQNEADGRYLKLSGGTLTGDLQMKTIDNNFVQIHTGDGYMQFSLMQEGESKNFRILARNARTLLNDDLTTKLYVDTAISGLLHYDVAEVQVLDGSIVLAEKTCTIILWGSDILRIVMPEILLGSIRPVTIESESAFLNFVVPNALDFAQLHLKAAVYGGTYSESILHPVDVNDNRVVFYNAGPIGLKPNSILAISLF